jgi:hypothetical protein
MKFKYETGIMTFVQFIVSSLFVLVTQFGSTTISCFKHGNECVSNIITSLLFFIVVSVTFGIIWLIGFAAQDRRSRRLAQLLICVEGMVGLIALFSVKLNLHTHNFFGLIGSLGLSAMALLIVRLAWRLMKGGGGRIVSKQRPRQRHRPTARQ